MLLEKDASSKYHRSHRTRFRSYKKKFMLNSAEHKILNAHKYKNIKKFSLLSQAQIRLECYFSFLLINVKMPAIVSILTFIAGKI